MLYAGLSWIGRDDFQIASPVKGKQSVLRATARMDAAESGANAGVLFDKRDAALQIVAAEKNVVEQRGYLLGCPGHA